jgi:hypothetical protein
VNPVGEFVNISHQRFRIIGMFEHYESELDRKARAQAMEQRSELGSKGPTRKRGQGSGKSKSGAGIAFEWKNNTVYIPLNTMWLKFRAGVDTNGTPDPPLSTFYSPVITVDAILLAFSFSVGVGILAGIFPGLKAARLHPIQALRYE